MATHEVGRRIAGRDNEDTIRWTPADRGVEGNDIADTWATAPAEGRPPEDDPAYIRETSLSHMARRATEAKSRAARDWIAEHVRTPDVTTRRGALTSAWG